MPKSRHRKKKSRAVSHSRYDERVTVMRRAASLSLRECLINDDWEENRMADIVFARQRADGHLAIGSFLVDLDCLGVKSAFGNPDVTPAHYQQRLVHGRPHNMVPFNPSCAVKMILGALEYAKALEFKPDPDYYYSREIFGDIDPNECQETFEYGRDGKPFYLAGPHDNVNRIINHLRRKLGPDGFHFLAPLAIGDEGEFYILDEEEDDDSD